MIFVAHHRANTIAILLSLHSLFSFSLLLWFGYLFLLSSVVVQHWFAEVSYPRMLISYLALFWFFDFSFLLRCFEPFASLSCKSAKLSTTVCPLAGLSVSLFSLPSWSFHHSIMLLENIHSIQFFPLYCLIWPSLVHRFQPFCCVVIGFDSLPSPPELPARQRRKSSHTSDRMKFWLKT